MLDSQIMTAGAPLRPYQPTYSDLQKWYEDAQAEIDTLRNRVQGIEADWRDKGRLYVLAAEQAFNTVVIRFGSKAEYAEALVEGLRSLMSPRVDVTKNVADSSEREMAEIRMVGGPADGKIFYAPCGVEDSVELSFKFDELAAVTVPWLRSPAYNVEDYPDVRSGVTHRTVRYNVVRVGTSTANHLPTFVAFVSGGFI